MDPYEEVTKKIETYDTLIKQWGILAGITGFDELTFVDTPRLKLEKTKISDKFPDFRMPKALKFIYFFNKWINFHYSERNDILVHWDIIYKALIQINLPIDDYRELYRGSDLFNDLKMLEKRLKKYYKPKTREEEMI